ncbi:MAG: protoporphyrinogen oxidase, partial [Gemmatimonadota bacterium]
MVGAGISGLATAHALRQTGLTATLFEKDERAGGSIQTVLVDGFLFEPGPNSVLDTSEYLRQLIVELGLREQVEFAADAARNRYVVRGGRLQALPLSPPGLIRSGLFSVGAKLRLLREPFVKPAPPEAEETLAEFVLRRLGREFLDYAVDPFVAGTFAGRPEELCVRTAFKRLYALEQNHGSLIRGAIRMKKERAREAAAGEKVQLQAGPGQRLFSFKGGMRVLVETLLAELGDAVRTGHPVQEVRAVDGGYALSGTGPGGPWQARARAVVLTLDAHAYARLRFGFEFPFVERFGRIPYPPVAAVFSGFRHDPTGGRLDGFGFLTPRVEGRRILGTLYNSCVFTGRAPAGGVAMTTFVGGRRQPDHAGWDDDRLRQAVLDEHRDLLGIEAPPDVFRIQRWPRAIPQYLLGHRQLVADLEAYEGRQPGLFLSGNFRGGISVADC